LGIVSLAGVLPLLLVKDYKLVIRQRRLLAMLFFVFCILVIERFVFINAYDLSRINEGKSLWTSLSELFNFSYLEKMFFFLMGKRWAFSLSLI